MSWRNGKQLAGIVTLSSEAVLSTGTGKARVRMPVAGRIVGVTASVLSAPDRVLGAGFGCVRGLVVAMILCVVGSMTPLSKAAVWQSSQGIVWLQAGLLAIKPVLPPQVLSYLPA